MKLRFNAMPGYFEEAGGEGGDGGGGGGVWTDGIAEEFRGDDALKPHADLNSLVKDYLGKSRMLGNRIPIPGDDADDATRAEFNQKLANVPGVFMTPGEGADDDAMNAYYTKLGRPATPEEYGISKPENMPEGVTYNEEAMAPMLKFMHGIGLTTAQVRQIVDYRMNEAGNEAKAMKTAGDAAAASLKGDWGAAYEQNVGIGKSAAGEFSEEDAAVLNNMAQSSPAVARALHKLGTATMEDTVLRQFGQGGESIRTPAEIEADISTIRGNPAFLDTNNPERKGLMIKFEKLSKELAKARVA